MKLPRFTLRELFLLVFAAACLCWGATQYRTTLEIRAVRSEANDAEKRAEEAIKRANERVARVEAVYFTTRLVDD